MIDWIAWAMLLLLQNGSFTLVSRARNSKSLVYHGVAAVLSNGIWFLSLGIAVNKLAEAREAGSWWLLAITAAFYTTFAVVGSVGMHHVLMTKVEKDRNF